jgi:uncharacterized protein
MRLSLDLDDAVNMIRSYQAGTITIGQQEISRSVLLSASECSDWPPSQFDQLQAEHFISLIDREPEMVILGTGATQRFPHPNVLRPLLEHGIGVEVMDTGAACRTYNVVVAEGRRVIAALLMI